MEVLTPASPFRRPEDLGGARGAVARLDRGALPWEKGGEKARPRTRLYYQVVLGSVDLPAAFEALHRTFADSREEAPRARGQAVLAVVILDQRGCVVDSPAAVVSSFGWALPRALRGELRELATWREAEQKLVEQLENRLSRRNDAGDPLPVDRDALLSAFEWLVRALHLEPSLVSPPGFAIRSFQPFRNPDPPEPLILNSFFLNDLSLARSLAEKGRMTPNLRRYMGVDAPAERRDLLRDRSALERAVAPDLIPPARWPGRGRHPLVMLQQAAVNLGMRELEDEGILAVNGPPGTGKTTLLRDLVAAVVTSRAEQMAAFDDPASAFTHSGEKIRAGQSWIHLYRLDPRLRGFELLVASSNNKAVENVSAELPALEAIAEDAPRLRYFPLLSDAVLGRETWGLVAAVLGNAENRYRFTQSFWWDEEVGLSTYLAAAAGTPKMVEEVDPRTGDAIVRPPRIVADQDPPRTHDDALRRWRDARHRFRAKLAESRVHLESLSRVRTLAAALPRLARAESDADAMVLQRREEEQRLRAAAAELGEEVALTRRRAEKVKNQLATQDRERPGFFARLFGTAAAQRWKRERKSIASAAFILEQNLGARSARLARLETELRSASEALHAAEKNSTEAKRQHAAARQEVAAARQRIGSRFVDAGLLGPDREALQRAVPWVGDEGQRLRDEVFEAAVHLHRAFVDAAARPLRHNLGALVSALGKGFPTEKQAFLPELWASLFLVVPLISTTFASVERMLGKLPLESLGWLLVDEAGQALPQAAVGALMRTRRALVVGDPMQIEPVVVLPEGLVAKVCAHFGVDADRFAAPAASVQTLADAATPYSAEFQSQTGSRIVGVPLLVHRRCAQPMFGVSNAIAYDGQMVHAKAGAPSPIGAVLGRSSWIDVDGSAEEKWSPQEGAEVLSLIRKLAASTAVPNLDLYVVSPFVIVAENVRHLLQESGVLSAWTDDPRAWTRERVGTVHTVQGREAEAVILVLGAPLPHQRGARAWAGRTPNLLNVAVTRAKERLYVVGNRRLWREAGPFGKLDRALTAWEGTHAG